MKNKIIAVLLFFSTVADCSQRPSRIPSGSSTPRTKCALTNMSTPTTVPDYSFQRTTPSIELPLGREYWFGTAQQPVFHNQVQQATHRARPMRTIGSTQRDIAARQRLSSSAPVIQTRRRASLVANNTPNGSGQQTVRIAMSSQQSRQPESPSYADMVRRNRQ